MGGWRETEVKTVNTNCINYLSDLTAGVAATKLQTSVRTKMVIVTQSRHISSSSSTNTVCVNRRLHNLHFFIARRYVSAAFAVVMCLSVRPSVRPSQAGMCRNHWTNRAGFWHGGFLPPIPHCLLRKFGCL